MHEVVLMAVRKAVSADTRTFTANSMIRCFFMVFLFYQEFENLRIFFRGMRRLALPLATEGRKKEE